MWLTGTTTPAVDMQEIITTVTGSFGDFSTTNLLTLIVAGIGVGAGLVLVWFGSRFLVRKLMGALKNARLG